MRAKPVQISIDRELLAWIDRDPQTKQQGRSAFIRAAVELYLAAKHSRSVDQQISAAYGEKSRGLLVETEPWLEEQAWPQPSSRTRRRAVVHRPKSKSRTA